MASAWGFPARRRASCPAAKHAPPGWAVNCLRWCGRRTSHMSRIGRKPVPLPKGVSAQIDGHRITVKGPKGEISRTLHEDMVVALEDTSVVVKRPSDEAQHKALHGLTRTL